MDTSHDASETEAAELAWAAEGAAPGQLLRQAKRLRDQAEKLVEQAVVAERLKETSWEVIGETLNGVSKSAAQKRFGPRFTAWVKETTPRDPLGEPYGTLSELLRVDALHQLADEWAAAARIVETQQSIAELSIVMDEIMGGDPPRAANSSTANVTTYRVMDSDHGVRRYRREESPDRPGQWSNLHSFKAQSRVPVEGIRTFGKIEVPTGQRCKKEPASSGLPVPTQAGEPSSSRSLEERVAALELIVEELTNEATRPR
ncbi:hypothetical protein ACWEWD_39750 [Streptomyces tendae]|uniref:hypothetical protein n=1 Tax=Streptomyces sp. H23 TaxID=2541723 RepID=UPI00106E946F|nr:hypothetical protein [Streptomyces sp. H23]